MKDFDYQHWLAVASRYSRRRSESSDLLHDALLDAIRANRIDFARDATKRWFAGVIRNRAAMTARTAARRTRRESIRREDRPDPAARPHRAFIDSLSPAARSVATLVVAGMNRDEILSALKLPPTAFRQRLTTIRRAWQKLPPAQRAGVDVDRSDPLDLGLMRRALLDHVKRLGGVGTHDPDGHLIVVSEFSPTGRSHSPPRRQQRTKENRNG